MVQKKRNEEFNYRKSLIFTIVSLLIIVIILSSLNILTNIYIDPAEVTNDKINKDLKLSGCEEEVNGFVSLDDSTRIEMKLPAVDSEGEGVNTLLTVEASEGSGRTLTDIDNLLFWADTQHSMRVARRVAENITGISMEDYDIVYTIEANASLIGGPSAGAALAIATIAALQNKELRDNVMITGGINHDGSISPVSAILEKAKAAKSAGAGLFLVPLLQSRDVVYEESEHCEVYGYTEICTTETRPKKIDVSKEAGIEVREVETIQDAIEYYF
jgi:uncharacterized protein